MRYNIEQITAECRELYGLPYKPRNLRRMIPTKEPPEPVNNRNPYLFSLTSYRLEVTREALLMYWQNEGATLDTVELTIKTGNNKRVRTYKTADKLPLIWLIKDANGRLMLKAGQKFFKLFNQN